jgi:hypothetical protein
MHVKRKETTMSARINRNLKPGTMVVAKEDGESGRIIRTCTFRRNGVDAWSYLVKTAYGTEIWETGELFVPANVEA